MKDLSVIFSFTLGVLVWSNSSAPLDFGVNCDGLSVAGYQVLCSFAGLNPNTTEDGSNMTVKTQVGDMVLYTYETISVMKLKVGRFGANYIPRTQGEGRDIAGL